MPGLILRFLALFFALFFALPLSMPLLARQAPNQEISQAIDQEKAEARLKTLEKEISNYRKLLNETVGEKSALEKALNENEKKISDLINRINTLEKTLQAGEEKISQLSAAQEKLLRAKNEQQFYIERQVRAAYEIGSRAYLKVLLNQEDPNEIARMLAYYDYLNGARADRINTYNNTIAELDGTSLRLTQEMAEQGRRRRAQAAEKSSLDETRRQKRKLLTALTREIKATGNEINRLEQDRDRLEQLLEKLQPGLADIPTLEGLQPFPEMQGQLLLPVVGKVSHRFGNRRSQGKLKWRGVFIDAGEGDPVYAVHHGRVVFSDWLRGFGLLMIISHGDGYMSLYGHNQALYRETGDRVTTGDVIATVGDSGGQNKAGLYFEIRVNGKPRDPQRWCIIREQGAA